MTDPQLEELISAHLDGELSADEQSRVERLLESDGAARSLADELRTLSNTLQALPQRQLPEDLSESILARANELASAGADEQLPAGDARKQDSQVATVDRPAPRSSSGWRGFVWAAMAIAASIMLLLFNTQSPVPELAKTDRGTESMVDGERAAGSVSNEEWREENDLLLADEVLEESAIDRKEMSRPGATMKPQDLDSFAAPGAPLAEEGEARPEAKSGMRRSLVGGGAGANTVAGKAGPLPLSANDAEVVADAPAPAAALRAPVADAMQVERLDRSEVAAKQSQVAVDRVSNLDGALFVQVNIRATAAKAGAFAQLLVDEDIAWDGDAESEEDGAQAKSKDQNFADVEDAKRNGKKLGRSKDSVDGIPVEVVVVEASDEQISRTLERIQSQTDDYAGYSLTPSNSPSVRQLADSYPFVAPVDVAPSTSQTPVPQHSKVATSQHKAAPQKQESPDSDSSRDKHLSKSAETTNKDDASGLARDHVASSGLVPADQGLTQAEGGEKGMNQARAKRYYIQQQDLPAQTPTALKIEGSLQLGPAVQQKKPAVARGARSFRTEAMRSAPVVADEPRASRAAKPAPQSVAQPAQAAQLQKTRQAAEVAPLDLKVSRQREMMARQATGGQSLARQSRAYFLLRVVPDDAATPMASEQHSVKSEAASEAPAIEADTVEAAAEQVPSDGAPPEP